MVCPLDGLALLSPLNVEAENWSIMKLNEASFVYSKSARRKKYPRKCINKTAISESVTLLLCHVPRKTKTKNVKWTLKGTTSNA